MFNGHCWCLEKYTEKHRDTKLPMMKTTFPDVRFCCLRTHIEQQKGRKKPNYLFLTLPIQWYCPPDTLAWEHGRRSVTQSYRAHQAAKQMTNPASLQLNLMPHGLSGPLRLYCAVATASPDLRMYIRQSSAVKTRGVHRLIRVITIMQLRQALVSDFSSKK